MPYSHALYLYIARFRSNLTPPLSGLDITYAGGWSLIRRLSLNLEISTNNRRVISEYLKSLI